MSESLFEEKPAVPEPEGGPAYSPLAARLAPKELDEFAGQEEILGPGKLLRRAIEADNLKSAVFFGPPGCGKTALARFIAAKSGAEIVELNAVTAGVADLKKALEAARYRPATEYLPEIPVPATVLPGFSWQPR